MIYTDGKPTVCSKGTTVKPVKKAKKSYKLLIRDLVRIQQADYLHSFNMHVTEHMKAYYQGKINACCDILDRIETM